MTVRTWHLVLCHRVTRLYVSWLNSLSTVATIVAEFGDCRQNRRRRQIVAEIGDCSLQCGQGLSGHFDHRLSCALHLTRVNCTFVRIGLSILRIVIEVHWRKRNTMDWALQLKSELIIRPTYLVEWNSNMYIHCASVVCSLLMHAASCDLPIYTSILSSRCKKFKRSLKCFLFATLTDTAHEAH